MTASPYHAVKNNGPVLADNHVAPADVAAEAIPQLEQAVPRPEPPSVAAPEDEGGLPGLSLRDRFSPEQPDKQAREC